MTFINQAQVAIAYGICPSVVHWDRKLLLFARVCVLMAFNAKQKRNSSTRTLQYLAMHFAMSISNRRLSLVTASFIDWRKETFVYVLCCVYGISSSDVWSSSCWVFGLAVCSQSGLPTHLSSRNCTFFGLFSQLFFFLFQCFFFLLLYERNLQAGFSS